MFNNYSQQYNIDRINNEIRQLENLKNSYQQTPQPINNIINPPIQQKSDLNIIEMRVLNENTDISNLYIQNKTVFLNDKEMVIKETNGKMEKYEIKKIYPIDEKDKRINELEKQIEELKGMINNEYTKFNEPIKNVNESDVNVDGNVKPKPKTNSK